MLLRFAIWIIRRRYRKLNAAPVLAIRGVNDKYPRFLLYSEDEDVYEALTTICDY